MKVKEERKGKEKETKKEKEKEHDKEKEEGQVHTTEDGQIHTAGGPTVQIQAEKEKTKTHGNFWSLFLFYLAVSWGRRGCAVLLKMTTTNVRRG